MSGVVIVGLSGIKSSADNSQPGLKLPTYAPSFSPTRTECRAEK